MFGDNANLGHLFQPWVREVVKADMPVIKLHSWVVEHWVNRIFDA